MSVYKVGDNYGADVFVKGVRLKRQSGFKTKTAAKAWHDQVKQELRGSSQDRIKREVDNDKRTLEDLSLAFIENYVKHHVKFRTGRRYELDINARILPFFRDMTVGSINAQTILLFQNKLSSTGLSERSVNHTMVVLSSVFKKGIQWGICNHNPCAGIKPLKIVQKTFRYWQSVEHIMQFLNANESSHYFTLFKFALETGLRLGEIIGLYKEAVDYISGRIVVFQQYDPEQKKVVSIKNDKIRYVWVNDDLLLLLKKLRLTNADSKFVFTEENGKIIEATKLSQRIFREAQLKAGVPYINFHGLRHTFASHFMMNGGSIYDLKSLLGHSTIDVTERYAHLSLDSLQKTKSFVNFRNRY